MMDRYAIVDNVTHLVVNVCAWDGVTEWSPPTGTTAVKLAADETAVQIGDVFNG